MLVSFRHSRTVIEQECLLISSVLNISDTGLSELPEELGDLHKLKALVAMGNPWTRLDSKVVEQWEQLNSLSQSGVEFCKPVADLSVVSHSPKLKGLPKGLNTLRHLAKLSFSHCPSLQAGGLPDFTDLPLLRDVKLNNLALLDKLPSHISTWGTGTLPASERSTARRDGDGLEVLDLGNCSLPYSTIEAIFLRKTWPHLRSLSLHSNPLAVSHPDYADLLQDSDTLPNLQIIDAKRVVERKRKGEVQETRLERRRRLKKEGRQSTGSNARIMTDKARMWGGKAVTNEGKADNGESSAAPAADASDRVVSESRRADALGRKRKRQRAETTDLDATATPRAIERSEDNRPAPTGLSDFPSENSKRRRRTKNHSSTEQSTLIESPAPVKSSGMPAATSSIDIGSAKAGSLPHGKRPRAVAAKVETIVDSSGGVNLKDVLGKPKLDEGSGSLGVGGW